MTEALGQILLNLGGRTLNDVIRNQFKEELIELHYKILSGVVTIFAISTSDVLSTEDVCVVVEFTFGYVTDLFAAGNHGG